MTNMKQILKTPRWLHFAATCAVWASLPAEADNYQEVVLADNPAAYYRFEELPGDVTLTDSSATGAYGGSYFSPDGVYPKLAKPGISTNSAFFHPYVDGGGMPMNPYAEVPYTSDLNQSGPFTAEVWVRATSASAADFRSPLSAFGGWGDSSGWFIYQSPEAGSPSTWIWVQKGGGIWLGGVPVNKFQWEHLVGVYDGKDVTFYVNGVQAGISDATTALPNSNAPLHIGTRDTAYGFFDGNVDEVAIYNSALSADRVRLHYEVGRTNVSNRPVSPEVVQEPVAATSYAGRSVKFSVGADGTAPLFYQWYKGNAAIEGRTNSDLVFASSITDNNAQYKVVITNAYGAVTSSPAALSVATDLLLVSSPASIERKVGSKAAFMAIADGAIPVNYQWYRDGQDIEGATNQTLWLDNLQLASDNTAYYVRISNAWNITNSETAMLTVHARETDVPLTGYAKVVALDDPVAFWRLDEAQDSTVAIDVVGSFDGTYTPGNGTITFGQTAGIPGETNAAAQVTGGARVAIPWALELNPHGPFTAEGWFMPTSTATDSGDYRTIFSSMGSGPTGWLLYQQPDNRFAWVVFNDNWISSFIGDTVDVVEANTWYHIALTYDGNLFRINVNGRQVASSRYDIFIPNRNGAANLGWRSDNDYKPFQGLVDDVAFYNKALTLEQIQAHHAASIRLGAAKSGNSIILSWPFGMLQEASSVEGAYVDIPMATSPYTVSIGGDAKFYRVKTQ